MFKRIYSLLILTTLGLAAVVLPAPVPAAAQAPTVPVDPLQDTYVTLGAPDQPQNGSALQVSYSNFFSGVTPSDFIYIQFDLSGASTSVSGSVLDLTIALNNMAATDFTLGLYPVVDDTWNADTLTHTNRPAGGDLLQSMTVASDATGVLTFGDTSGAHPLGVWLEQERRGDGTASLLLALDGINAPTGFSGSLVFDDVEGTFDGRNGNEPRLDLLSPTAITLYGARTAPAPAGSYRLLLIVLLLSGATGALLLARRFRRI